MRWIGVLILGVFVVPSPMLAGPPTVGPETTYYQAPLDDEGYVDYVAVLNAAFGDADAQPQDNAFSGILDQVDTSNWIEGHVPALYTALNAKPSADVGPRFVTFYDYGEALGLPLAPLFDWQNAGPDEEPPPPRGRMTNSPKSLDGSARSTPRSTPSSKRPNARLITPRWSVPILMQRYTRSCYPTWGPTVGSRVHSTCGSAGTSGETTLAPPLSTGPRSNG